MFSGPEHPKGNSVTREEKTTFRFLRSSFMDAETAEHIYLVEKDLYTRRDKEVALRPILSGGARFIPNEKKSVAQFVVGKDGLIVF